MTTAQTQSNEIQPVTEQYDSLPRAQGHEREIEVGEIVQTRYGDKLPLDTPFEAKDAVKALSWDATHRAWDGDRTAWMIDAHALTTVAEELAASGWRVVKPVEPDTDAVRDLVDSLARGDTVRVDYLTKQNQTPKSVTGTVSHRRPSRSNPAFHFEREGDAHIMKVDRDGLYTSGSHYPFMGVVETVTVNEVEYHGEVQQGVRFEVA